MAALGYIDDSRHQPQMRSQDRFLEAFATCANVLRASRWAKVNRTAHYFWLDTDPTYSARFKAAERRAARTLEDEAVRRAHEGLRRPVLYQGKPVRINGEILYEHEYSDSLLIQLLKAYNRERFGDKQQVSLQWNGDPSSLTDEQLEQMHAKFVELAAQQKQLGPVVEATAEVVKSEGDGTNQ